MSEYVDQSSPEKPLKQACASERGVEWMNEFDFLTWLTFRLILVIITLLMATQQYDT